MVAASHPPLTSIRQSGHVSCSIWTGLSSLCVLGGWEMVCPCDSGRLFCYAWVFFLAGKGETFGIVQDLILRLKNEINGDVVRAICSNTKFKNSHFETFCRDSGLEHQFYSPYVACQNAVVEKKNHSLCAMSRTMLDEHRTPMRYWAKAVNTACHVGNHIFL
jgi:hypothetical protein